MNRLGSKFVGLMVAAMALSQSPRAYALVCPSPHEPTGTTWCDPPPSDPPPPSRYANDTLCVVEPVDGPPASSIDEEVVGGGVCILGKFKTAAQFQKLADFVVSYDFPANPLMGPSGVFVPELAAVAGTREFRTIVPLDGEGVFDISIQGRVLNDDGSFQDVNFARRVLRVAVPHLTITRARLGNTTNACDGTHTDPTDVSNCFETHEDTVDTTVADHPAHKIQLAPPSGGRASTVELCVQNHDTEAEAGTSILVRAINTVTDNGVTPAKQIMVDTNCAAEGETLCQAATDTDTFCPGGFKVSVPLGNGRNEIELFVDNLITGYDVGAGERITVDPFDVDLKGPSLCVGYLNDAAHRIADVDGRALLPSEATAVTLDVALGACGSIPEAVSAMPPVDCDPANPPPCGNAPVCMNRDNQLDGEGHQSLVALCAHEAGGVPHYQARLSNLLYPINTLQIHAADNLGNQTVETHFFGFGNVRPLFNHDGQLDIKNAMIPKGVGGFVDANFVKNELMPVILKAVNSDKFKNDFFFKLLDPRQPGDEEISCLKSIEDSLNCTMDHLASKARVVTIKAFCDNGCKNNIGAIEIPSFYMMSGNRIRVQVKIKGIHSRAEMYTMQFGDSDNDSIADTEDDDADNDGICDHYITSFGSCTDANHDGVCDEEVGLTGSQGHGLNASHKCVLDKTVAQGNCSDPEARDARDYFGCSDQDDDNDGVPDNRDLPGRVVPDPDFGTYVLPLLLQIKELALNLDIQFQKDASDHLQLQITTPAAVESMVQAIADSGNPGNLIEFDCDKDVSEVYQGGHAGDEGNGRNITIDTGACNGLKSLSNGLNHNGNAIQSGVISVSQFLGLVDRKKRQNEGTNQQLTCTLAATAICSIPKRVEATLAGFDDNKVAPISVKLLDNRFHMDFFAPLGTADIFVDSRGLGFSGKGLLLPAGVSDASDEAERNAQDFLNALPAEFKNGKFGPLSKYGTGPGVDPVVAAMEMGDEINLALNEETINSTTHSVALLLWDLARKQGENHQMLDLTAKKLREDFDMGIPDIGDTVCLDKNRQKLYPALGDGGTATKWDCFPFPLDIENILGPTTLKYVDFDGDGAPGSDRDKLAPVLIRNGMNPFFPPTVKIVSVSPVESWGGDGPIKAPVVIAELEIGLGNATMSLFEEKVADWRATPIAGTGEIKDWCDSDRYPGANQPRCDGSHKLPMVTFGLTGRVFATLMLTVDQDGIIRVEGGLSSVERLSGGTAGEEMELDKTKTDIQFNVLENNTIVPDNEIAAVMKGKIDLILPKYLFGNARDIRVNIPAQVPLQAFCTRYAEDLPHVCDCVAHPDHADCDNVSAIQDLWDRVDLEQFGLKGVTVVHPLLGVSDDEDDPIRFLTIGTGVNFDLTH